MGVRHVIFAGILFALVGVSTAQAAPQTEQPGATQPPVQLQQLPGDSAAPLTVTLSDALQRARQNDPSYLSATADLNSAHEDRVQAKAAMLPGVTETTQALLTQANGIILQRAILLPMTVRTSTRNWAVIHEDLSRSHLYGYRNQACPGRRGPWPRQNRKSPGAGLTVTVAKELLCPGCLPA